MEYMNSLPQKDGGAERTGEKVTMTATMKLLRSLSFVAVLSLLFACQGGSAAKSDAAGTVDGAQAATLPSVSETLAGRLAAMWEGYDFANSAQENRDAGEQLFSNFIYTLQYADSATASNAVASFYGKASAHESSRSWCHATVDHYLANPDSPFRNDAVYAHFLTVFIASCSDEVLSGRARYILDMISRNRPGTVAADFGFVDRNGRAGTLHSLDARLILLVFNDPGCDKCREMMPSLLADPLFASEGLLVLSVYPYDDAALWRECATPMPGNWLDVHDAGSEIIDGRLYHLPAMPSFYLLNGDKRVLLKDAPVWHLREVLSSI